MSSKVEVLCPNGHRITVKTTPGSTILQILEEVCTKKDFHPPEEYELKHGKKVLDVTLGLRYSGLPNLAKLELVKASKPRASSTVFIALQTPSGERLQHDFLPTCSLWDLLVHWENGTERQESQSLIKCPSGQQPVCIFMREEIIGEYAMKETTLKKLGLTSGKAIIRLVHREISDDNLSKIKESIDQEKARQTKIAAKAVERQYSQSDTMATSTGSVPDPLTDMEVEEARLESAMETEPEEKPGSVGSQASKHADKHCPGATAGEIPPATSQGDEAGEGNPLTQQQEKIARQLAQHIMPGIFPEHDAAYEARQAELERLRLERRTMAEVKQRQMALAMAQPHFDNFKFPEATKGKDLYRNELSEVDKTEYKPCDREVVVYNLEEPRTQVGEIPMELPDDFFDVTEADIRKMWQDLQRQAEDNANAPMMTKAMKKAQFETKIMAKYERVILRLHFPDKFVVQALFRPKETVFAVEKFVQDHLENRNMSFYLYTAPPRVILKDNAKTLIEAKLAPMSIVYVGSECKLEHFLSAAVMNESSSQGEADQIIVNHMPVSMNMQANKSSSEDGPQSGKRQGAVANTEPGKVPKWFKIGKK